MLHWQAVRRVGQLAGLGLLHRLVRRRRQVQNPLLHRRHPRQGRLRRQLRGRLPLQLADVSLVDRLAAVVRVYYDMWRWNSTSGQILHQWQFQRLPGQRFRGENLPD